jgi:hypothetical protein
MSGNPSKDVRENLQLLPGIEDKVPKNREPLPSCSYTFIDGDFVGLRHLSDNLYWFAWQCDHGVKNLTSYVERLIGEGGSWQSDTATVFRSAYGQDAIIANGFARDICEIARIIDQLALRLAKLEAQLEQFLQIGIRNKYLMWSSSTVTAQAGQIVMANPRGGWVMVDPQGGAAAQGYGVNLTAKYQAAVKAAERLRKNATGELAALCAPLSKSLDYYLKRDENDTGGLLSPSQKEGFDPQVKKLQADYADSVRGLNASDLDNAVKDATKIGGDVKTIGDIIGEMKGLKGADLAKSVGNAGDKVSKIGSVVEDILLLLAVAPK